MSNPHEPLDRTSTQQARLVVERFWIDYAAAVDDARWEDLAALLGTNVSVVIEHEGIEVEGGSAAADTYRRLMAGRSSGAHLTLHHAFDVTDSEIVGHCGYLFIESSPMRLVAIGTYETSFARRGRDLDLLRHRVTRTSSAL